jgi:uncharacterized protein (TIGR02271 family)
MAFVIYPVYLITQRLNPVAIMAQQTVVGIFDNASEAQKAIDELVDAGFMRSNIDLSAQTGTNSDDSYSTNTYNTGTTGSTNTSDSVVPDRHRNTSGTFTEEVADDTKDVGDSIGDFFSNLFGVDDNDNHRKYADVARRGSVVTVHAQSEDEAERAADILDDNGTVDVDERATQYGHGAMGGVGVDDTNRNDADQTIKVIEENLEVGKREVETGGVRVRSRIVERPVEESVRLRQERVTVQRNPVNRPATDADLNAFKEGTIEVTEHTEVPVVSKTANVLEEISVGKEVNERTETVKDTVRKTDVEVENIDNKDPEATNISKDYDDNANKPATTNW